jgi:hypothetical protein
MKQNKKSTKISSNEEKAKIQNKASNERRLAAHITTENKPKTKAICIHNGLRS